MDELTKADSRALWHAVQDMIVMHRAAQEMHTEGKLTEEQVSASGKRLQQARSALFKVQKIAGAKVRTAASMAGKGTRHAEGS